MTDDTGIFQHAKYTVPDRDHGYCTDDNARALDKQAWLPGDGDVTSAHFTSYPSGINGIMVDIDSVPTGYTPTAADFCLFPTLYRFDTVYHTHFKCNRRQLRDYPNLWAFTRDIYSLPRVQQTCDLAQAAEHYYTSHESIHPRRYIPLGPGDDLVDWEEPHDRDDISC